MNLAHPRSLREPDEVASRLELLRAAPAAAPLAEWLDEVVADRLAEGLPAEMPYVDPLDAGTDARVLIILEAPGPGTNASNLNPGSGFISSDNDDWTAENLWRARQASGLMMGF